MVHLHKKRKRRVQHNKERAYDINELRVEQARLGSLTAQTAGKGDVLGLDGDTLSVNGSQVGVFEERDEVGLQRIERARNRTEGERKSIICSQIWLSRKKRRRGGEVVEYLPRQPPEEHQWRKTGNGDQS